MNRAVGIAMLVVGIILMVWGVNASESLGSEFSEFFTGSPSEKSIWLLIGGIVCAIVGAFGVFRTVR